MEANSTCATMTRLAGRPPGRVRRGLARAPSITEGSGITAGACGARSVPRFAPRFAPTAAAEQPRDGRGRAHRFDSCPAGGNKPGRPAAGRSKSPTGNEFHIFENLETHPFWGSSEKTVTLFISKENGAFQGFRGMFLFQNIFIVKVMKFGGK